MNCLQRFWRDESGFVVSTELVLGTGVLTLGLVAGATALRDQINQEMADMASAISDINQSYEFAGVRSASASTAGSYFVDRTDYADPAGDLPDSGSNCMSLDGLPSPEI